MPVCGEPKRFDGLTSRWSTPVWCALSSASATASTTPHTNQSGQPAAERGAAAAVELGEIEAVDVLLHEVRGALVDADVDGAHHARARDARHQPRLVAEAGEGVVASPPSSSVLMTTGVASSRWRASQTRLIPPWLIGPHTSKTPQWRWSDPSRCGRHHTPSPPARPTTSVGMPGPGAYTPGMASHAPRLQVTEDIVPLSDLVADVAGVVQKLRVTGRAVVLTEAGRPAAVLLTPEEFDDSRARDRVVAAVERGRADVRAGRVIDDEQLTRELDAELGLAE